MATNNLSMEMKHRFNNQVKIERENEGFWLKWAKAAVGSCGLWHSHVKGEPLEEMAMREGQTRGLKEDGDRAVQGELHQLVGKLKYLWAELDALRSSTSDLRAVQERLEQDVIFSLLVSLNSSYGQMLMHMF